MACNGDPGADVELSVGFAEAIFWYLAHKQAAGCLGRILCLLREGAAIPIGGCGCFRVLVETVKSITCKTQFLGDRA